MTKTFSRSIVKNLFAAVVFAAAVALGGCSTDAIVGPETTEGPSVEASSNPHYPVPPNDDCSVGDC